MILIDNKIKIIKLLQYIVIITIVVGTIVGLSCYSGHLHNQLKNVKAELESVETQLESVETQMDETNKNLESTKNELNVAHEEIKRLQNEIEDEEAKWKRRYEEYPVATEAWIAMKTKGWSDIVCAGIMGNLMAETGGGTLHLDWDSNDDSGYGLVQWIGSRRKAINNKYGEYPSVKEQMQFMYDELYGTNGVRLQVTDRQLNEIMNAETPEDCAYAFACYYERCATKHRGIRKGFAQKAYNYFVS